MRRLILLTMVVLGGCGAIVRLNVARFNCLSHSRGMRVSTDGSATCESLYENIEYATLVGAAFGIWPVSATWAPWHVQAVKTAPLPSEDTGNPLPLLGVSDFTDNEMMITTGWGRAQFQSTMVHEMIHVHQGGNSDHCGWAKYAPLFDALHDGGIYDDRCASPPVRCSMENLRFRCVPIEASP
jgi:hypothetical protein